MTKLATGFLILFAPLAVADDKPVAEHTVLAVYEEYDRITDRTEISVELGLVADTPLSF